MKKLEEANCKQKANDWNTRLKWLHLEILKKWEQKDGENGAK